MPRKGLSNFDDYDDGFDDDDDAFDYDYDVDIDEHEEEAAAEPKEEIAKTQGLWRCAICTYDNVETMFVCDICGVLRHPVAGNQSINKNTVESRCKEPVVSKLAKSLFGSVPSNKPKRAVLCLPEHTNLVMEQGPLPGISRGNIHDLYKAFSSKNSCVSIAPFKFDAPSPDDLVSNGLTSSKTGPKGSGDASMRQKEKQDSVEQKPLKKGGDSSETSSRGRHDKLDDKGGAGGIKSGKSLPKAKADMSNETSSSSKYMETSESLTGTMNKMSLIGETENSSDIKIRGPKSQSKHKPEEWMLLDKESDALSQLNLAIVGHVDSGKSTLSGRLLHLLGRISQKQMHKYEKEAKLQGKGSFAYAWALDESAEERERGITMTVAVAYFNSKRHHVVLLDSPGHKDFVPNMIAGATQADAAILVIDASVGAFEAGFDNLKGQTREHARVLRGFGVEQVIVAINKMDIVGYSKERFDLIKQHVGSFLQSCRFKDSSLTWIPLSAMENQNLVAAPSDNRLSSWYQGPCLLDAVDSVKSPDRDVSKPLLMPICDAVRSTSQGQVSACGKLEAGAVRPGSKVMVMPSGDQGTIRSLERDSQACTIARAGDNVALALQGIDANQVMAGDVLCHPDFPVSVATHLELMVLVLEGATPILLGSQLEFHVHHAKEAATVVKLVAMLDPKTGQPTKKSPRCLTAKQSAMLEVSLQNPVCVETFSESRALGRVFLRSSGRTVAMGKVTRIIQDS
ncbi:Translation elongation factor EF1A/initiation factor IF2gamma family protein [Arabidopsis thaliana]|uniref:Translation elongation factor EF1A/initiation factor IF2gamma family protein n=1 Tax=Arabidopsis thaliana TaxID=3702 RepID=A0A1P8BFE6_ARATH|nr:Translation elongation factor EF1A/initiation factor IF2gamma family protein [Arabidopsis thaliana]ANM70320.1 Translation elongation factor EF1A/initiation factor IF2gamma family protein [Arabidopsis thaliana]|eukprot:NP_001331941.1 Translation elongation factor EF1A/initiation factor IF2gamma family protein [Arabidopsis thaliana]